MTDRDDQGKPYLTGPSKLPNDREYERLAAAEAAQLGRRLSRSDAPEAKDIGVAESRKGFDRYNQARLDAKTQVVQMTPQLLNDYKNQLKEEINARRNYSYAVFIFVTAWLAFVAVVIVLAGSQMLLLGSNVLVALTTGATVSIIGLLGTVITYFFTKSNEQIKLYKELFQAMIDEERDRPG